MNIPQTPLIWLSIIILKVLSLSLSKRSHFSSLNLSLILNFNFILPFFSMNWYYILKNLLLNLYFLCLNVRTCHFSALRLQAPLHEGDRMEEGILPFTIIKRANKLFVSTIPRNWHYHSKKGDKCEMTKKCQWQLKKTWISEKVQFFFFFEKRKRCPLGEKVQISSIFGRRTRESIHFFWFKQ